MALRSPTIVQSVVASYATVAAGSVTATFASAITKGNGVFFLLQTTGTAGAWMPNNSFTYLFQSNTGAGNGVHDIHYCYKTDIANAPTSFTVYLNAAGTGHLIALELQDCDMVQPLETSGGSGTALSSSGTGGVPFSTGMLIGVIGQGDLTGAIGGLSGVTAGYSSLLSNTKTNNAGTIDYKVTVYTQSITTPATDPTLAATSASTDRWCVGVLMAAKTCGVQTWGFETNSNTGSLTSGTGTFTIAAAQKRTGSGGTYGALLSAAANNVGRSLYLPFMPHHFYLHQYVRVETAPASTQPIMWCGAIRTTPSGVVLYYNQSTGKFNLAVRSNTRTGSAFTTETNVDGATCTAQTWYRIEILARHQGTNKHDLRVSWWIDGVKQTDLDYAQPTTTSAACQWYHGAQFLTIGNIGSGSTATFEYWFDDIVVIANYYKYMTSSDDEDTSFPLGAMSTSILVADGHGTDNNNAHFQDNGSASWGTPDYTKVADAFAGTGDYAKQVTANVASYIELTIGSPGASYLGAGTVWWNRTTAECDMHLLIGGDEYQVMPGVGGTAGSYLGNGQGSTSTTGFSGWDIMDTASPATMYDATDLAGMTVRWGYSNNVGTNPRLNTFMVEVISLPVISLGGDQWGWSESQDAWGAVAI